MITGVEAPIIPVKQLIKILTHGSLPALVLEFADLFLKFIGHQFTVVAKAVKATIEFHLIGCCCHRVRPVLCCPD